MELLDELVRGRFVELFGDTKFQIRMDGQNATLPELGVFGTWGIYNMESLAHDPKSRLRWRIISIDT